MPPVQNEKLLPSEQFAGTPVTSIPAPVEAEMVMLDTNSWMDSGTTNR